MWPATNEWMHPMTVRRRPRSALPGTLKNCGTTARPTHGLLSWQPIVAAYDTLHLGSVPDDAYSSETLEAVRRARSTREFVSWNTYLNLLQQARDWCGSDDRFVAACTHFDSAVPELRAFATSRVGVHEFARFVIESYDSASYPEVSHATRVLDDGRLELKIRLPPHYRDGQVWFVGNIGSLRTISRHLGLPLASVEAEVGTHHGTYLISFPPDEQRAPLPVPTETGGAARLFNILRDDFRLAVAQRSEARDPTDRVKEMSGRWGLTRQETKVLGGICRALANKEIAVELSCSVRTIEVHVTHVLKKAGLDSRAHLVAHFASGH